ncbi:MAG: energy transducer TonB [Flavobacterium sp.]|nr:energy transducer TonB [Flavobacterium sp.]
MKKCYLVLISIISVLMIFAAPMRTSAQDEYAAVCETPPSAVGGDAAIYKAITYPELAKKAKLEGKVYILILINEKGTVDDAKVIKGIGLGCDEAALSAVKKAKFNPGKNGGIAIKAKLTMAINFKLGS